MRSKKAILNIVVSLVLQIVTLICGFIVPKLLIKNFGSDVNGLTSSITQFLAYITLLEAGFGPVVKAALYKPIAKKNKKEIDNILKASERFFRIIALIFVIYLVVLAIIYPMFVNTQFDYLFTMSLVLIISISTLAEYYFGMTYQLYLQAEQNTYVTATIQIIGYILNTVAILILVKFNFSIQIVKLVSGIIFVLRPLAQNMYVKKKYKLNLKEADKNYQLKQKWDGLAQHIAAEVHNNTDITILTIFTEMTEVSVYSVYYLVVKGIKAIIQAFTGGIDASFGDMIARGEKEQLNKSFNAYELFYFTITTIAYTCTLILIVPFIKVYTAGITDANYIRPLFASLLVISEFIWAVRLPYSGLTLAAGHFKQTRKGAWVEAISNIVISLILVWKLGITGVAIGTLVAMAIRTVEFMYHSSKHILDRSILNNVKRVLIIFIEVLTIVGIVQLLPEMVIESYTSWIVYAIYVAMIATIVTILFNFIVYKRDVKGLISIIKRSLTRKENKSMKTYFVTGGAGFIGSSLCERLLKEGNKVIAIDNFCDFYSPKVKEHNIKGLLENSNFKLYRNDIRDKEAIKKIFDENHIDVVVHLAAMAGVRPSIENPVLYQEVNCMGTQNILEEMKAHNINQLVMASSSSVYGNCKEVPFKEDMIVDFAISPYAATKKANEVMTHVYHQLFNMKVIMLRFFTVYGPKQRPDLAINKFTRLMLADEEIPMFGDGTTSRDYTYIDDIVDGIIRSCDYVEKNENVYEILNLGNSSPVSLKEMIETIAKVIGVTPKINQLPMQPGDVERTFADVSKAKQLIGYNPKTSFEDGIKSFVNWYQQNRGLYQ